MRIFLVARGCPAIGDPQWGNFELDQARALTKLGNQVTILYIDGRFRLSNWKEFGIRRYTVTGINYVGSFFLPSKMISWIGLRLFRELRSKQLDVVYKKATKLFGTPDVIYAHYMHNIAYAVSLKEKFGVPLVGIEHWSNLNKDELTAKERYYGEIAYTGADKLIAVSDSLRGKILKHFGKESIVVNNMVGEIFFRNNSVVKHLGNCTKLVSVGSLIHRKGFDLLIDALHSISNTLSCWELNIVGDGQDKNTLVELANKYKLENHIHFLGKKNQQEIIDILKASDAFVLASRAETFGVVYVEALSLGLPVIATSCGGPEEFVHDGNGILIPTNDVKALTTALYTMLDTVNSYDRVAIAEECQKRFSPDVIGKKLSELLSDAIHKS